MDVTTASAPKLFIKYALFSTFGMLAMTSAGIIDGYFIGNYVGATALASVNIIIPIFSVLVGIALCLGIGGSVVGAKLLAKRNFRIASKLFSRIFFTIITLSLCISILVHVNLEWLLKLLGANEEILPLAYEYLGVMNYFFPIFMSGIVLDHFAKADSSPNLAFQALFIGAIVNVIGDYLLIVTFDLKMFGASLATGISFLTIFLILLPHFLFKKGELRFVNPFGKAPSVVKIAYNGFAQLINESSVGLTTFVFNITMLYYFDTAGVAAFSIISYLLWIGLMSIFGTCDSLQPLVSKNFGVRKPERVAQFLKLGIGTVLSVGVFSSAILLFFSDILSSIFLKDDAAQSKEIAKNFILFIWPIFLFNGFNLAISSYFTAMQKPKLSTIIALSRSLILPVALILTLPPLFGAEGVFVALPLAEFFTFLISTYLLYHNTPHKLITTSTCRAK